MTPTPTQADGIKLPWSSFSKCLFCWSRPLSPCGRSNSVWAGGGWWGGGSICKPVPTRPWGKRHWPSKLGLCLPSSGSHWTTFLDLAVLDLWKSNQSARRRPGNGNRGVALPAVVKQFKRSSIFLFQFFTLELKGGIKLRKGVRILLFVSMAT